MQDNSVIAHVNTNEFKAFWEEAALAKSEQQIICLANLQLVSHVCESVLKVPRPANDVIHNDLSVSIIIYLDTVGCAPSKHSQSHG